MFRIKNVCLVFAMVCSLSLYAAPSITPLVIPLDENTANNTVIGQLSAVNGDVVNTFQIEAGDHELINWKSRGEDYSTVNFSQPFSQTPIIFGQVQSYGVYNVKYTVDSYSYSGSLTKTGYDILFRPRLKNTSTSGFDTILETDLYKGGSSVVESIDTVGDTETIGWLAVSQATQGVWANKPFEFFESGTRVSEETSTLSYSGPFDTAPQVQTTLASTNDNARAGVGITSLNTNSLKVFVDEIDDNEHGDENVSVFAMQGTGALYDVNGVLIGEVGEFETEDTSRDNAPVVNFINHYVDPVVFVQPIGLDDYIYDASFRFKNISSNSFSGYLHDQKEYLFPKRHGDIKFQYVVIEKGQWTIGAQNYVYAIESGNDNGAFKIDANTGVIAVNDSTQLDYESGLLTFNLIVSVSDGVSSTQTSVQVDLNNIPDSLNSDAQTLLGNASNDWFGWAATGAGDVNGDGFDDVIISAPQADTTASNAGNVYVLLGNSTGTLVSLSEAESGIGGFLITGAAKNDKAGQAVAGNADINGDGLSDIVIGAPYTDYTATDSGAAYVVFGKTTTETVVLSDLENETNNIGFIIKGATAYDHVGGSIVLGDVNGDGLADITLSDINRTSLTASVGISISTYKDEHIAYTVFGKADGVSIKLSEVIADTDTRGFSVKKANNKFTENWRYGNQVMPVGDFNSDGLTDYMVNLGLFKSSAGETHLVFGRSESTVIDYASVTEGNDGIKIHPEGSSIYYYNFSSNGSVGNTLPSFTTSAIGDVNGDGIDDLALLAADPHCCDWATPRAYIVYGNQEHKDIYLSDIAAGVGGFIIENDASNITFSESALVFGAIGGLGDVNGDGYDDIGVGDIYAENGNGRLYIVYGKPVQPSVLLSEIVAGDGGYYTAGNGGDALGNWISSAGDINGAGISDVLLGTPHSSWAGPNKAGATYIMLGKGEHLTQLGTQSDDNIQGELSEGNNISAGQGHDFITSNGLNDVLYGGPGDDYITIDSTDVIRINGGNGTDTLVLNGQGLFLNLATAASRVRSIEVFDISGSGANTLSLNKSVSSNSKLVIKGDADDTVYSANQQWANTGITEVIDGVTYNRYAVGSALLLLQNGLSISINNAPTINEQSFTVSEYSVGGSVMGSVIANANDIGDLVTYAVISGNDDDLFNIDNDSGVLSISDTVSRLDYENDSYYSLTILVTDLYGETDRAIITINVTNIDTISHHVSFDVSGQASIWGENVLTDLLALSMQETSYAGKNFTQDLGNIDIDTAGILDVAMSGTIGFEPALTLEGGWVDATLPLTLDVNYPDEVEAGQIVELTTALNFEQGVGFTATAPYFNLTVTSSISDLHVAVSSSVVDNYNGETSIPYASLSKTIESADIASASSSCATVTATSYVDMCTETGADSVKSLRLVAKIEQDEWINEEIYWGINWEAWYAGAGFQYMQMAKEKCVDDFFAPAGDDLSYRMSYSSLDTFVSATADLYQDFTLDIEPTAILILEDGSEFAFDPAASLQFVPELTHDVDGNGIIDAELKVSVTSVFNNHSQFSSGVSIPFKAVEGSYNIQEALCTDSNVYLYGAGGKIYEVDSFGPIIDTEFSVEFSDLSLGGVITYDLATVTHSEHISFDLCDSTKSACADPVVIEPVNTAPAASHVYVSNVNTPRTGVTLTGSHTFTDAENDNEGATLYQWYASSEGNNDSVLIIDNATASTFTVTDAESGQYVQFCVTPHDGKDYGAVSCSEWQYVYTLSTDMTTGFYKALHFDGADQYGVINTYGEFNPQAHSFTIETWFKLDNIYQNQNLVQQLDGSGTGRTILGIDAGIPYSYLGKARLMATSSVKVDNWHHIALTYDINSRLLSIYFDGELENSVTRTVESADGDLMLSINKIFNGRFIAGAYEETRIWTAALSAEQIQQNMALSVDVNSADLFAYFNYDNDDGTTVTDLVAGHDMTLYNQPTYIYTTEHTVSFDGEGDYIEVADHADLEFAQNSFSLEAWFYADVNSEVDFRNIVSKKLGTGVNAGWVIRLAKSNGQLTPSFLMGDGTTRSGLSGNVLIANNTWYHIAATVDRANDLISLYLNGDVVATTSINGVGSVSAEAPMRIGTWSLDSTNEDYYMGDLDEIRIWRTVRSQAEIQEAMYSRIVNPSVDLVAYYDFESATPIDASANGHDGIFNGNTLMVDHSLANAVYGTGNLIGVLPNPSSGYFELVNDAASGSVVIDKITGEFTYTANNSNQTVTDSFSYIILDANNSYSLTQTVYINQ